MGIRLTGTPFVGYISLTSAAPGPVNIAIFNPMGGAAYTLSAAEMLVVTNITVSSNDTAAALVTVDTAGTTPTKLLSSYLSSTLPPVSVQAPTGCVHGIFGVPLRATATAVTAGKTVEIVVYGLISRT